VRRKAYLPANQHIVLTSLIIGVSLWLVACTQLDVFEKNIVIPKNQWQYSLKPSFDFIIKDTAASYNIYIVLRHTDAYRFNNIWLNLGTQSPGDTTRYQKFDLQLGTDAKGWEGTGMDDIWEVRKLITNGPVKFNKSGNYRFSVAHIMRINPLADIMSVGIRVEKAK
jgi:gliding motility-associated lipoprotein GldH